MSRVRVSVDLTFELDREGRSPVRGRLTGHDSALRLEVDDPAVFAGAGDASGVRTLAAELARRGLSVAVRHDGQHLVTLGRVSTSWWQRRFTGSRHSRLGSVRGAWTSARARAKASDPVLPDPALAPPATMWPLAPTIPRRLVTTTHDPARGGGARLVQVPGAAVGPGARQAIYWLGDGTTTIGSAAGNDVRLPGLSARHAEVHHDERQRLRTGTRVELGDHVLAFTREEYADHGRPFGGRIGGELGRNVPQPPREQVTP